MTSKAGELYQAGRLADAVAAQLALVKANPAGAELRGFLCELLCFGADLQRIDTHLDAIARLDPKTELGTAEFRQIVRGEQARRACFTDGALPEFVGDPSPTLREHLRALALLRSGDEAGAAQVLAIAEEGRPTVAGTCDGQAFDDIRDLDDLCAPFLEVLTTTGKYFWIAMEQLVSVEFRAPQRARDIVWRSALMHVRNGPEGAVYVPALYPLSHTASAEATQLGRATDWLGAEDGPVRGAGQRMMLVGEVARPILEIGRIDVEAPVYEAPEGERVH